MAAHVARLTRPRFASRLLLGAAYRMRDAIRGRSRMRPPTDYGERTLVRERDVIGHPIVATTHALYHYPAADMAPGRHFRGKVHPHAGEHPIPPGWRRLGWEEIAKVSWDSVRHVLTVTGLPGRRAVAALGPDAAIDLYLVRRSRLVDLARDRVASTLVVRTGDGPAPARLGRGDLGRLQRQRKRAQRRRPRRQRKRQPRRPVPRPRPGAGGHPDPAGRAAHLRTR
jgi:hypothetical protein